MPKFLGLKLLSSWTIMVHSKIWLNFARQFCSIPISYRLGSWLYLRFRSARSKSYNIFDASRCRWKITENVVLFFCSTVNLTQINKFKNQSCAIFGTQIVLELNSKGSFKNLAQLCPPVLLDSYWLLSRWLHLRGRSARFKS